jgi:hypothetical protein
LRGCLGFDQRLSLLPRLPVGPRIPIRPGIYRRPLKRHLSCLPPEPSHLKHGSQKVSVDEWITKSCFYAGVQITPKEDDIMEANPDENSLMTFRLQRDPRVGKPMSEARADIWKRRVVRRSKEWFAITQTDFCVMLIMPRNGEIPRRAYSWEQFRPRDQPQRAHIEVTYNTEAVIRKLAATHIFCHEKSNSFHRTPSSKPKTSTITLQSSSARSPNVIGYSLVIIFHVLVVARRKSLFAM